MQERLRGTKFGDSLIPTRLGRLCPAPGCQIALSHDQDPLRPLCRCATLAWQMSSFCGLYTVRLACREAPWTERAITLPPASRTQDIPCRSRVQVGRPFCLAYRATSENEPRLTRRNVFAHAVMLQARSPVFKSFRWPVKSSRCARRWWSFDAVRRQASTPKRRIRSMSTHRTCWKRSCPTW
jgi:hypothetical protein